jgi:hypothetical protein
MTNIRFTLTALLFTTALTCAVPASSHKFGKKTGSNSARPSADTSQMTPVMDGGAGPCSLDLSVTNDGKPAVAAHVRVHIAYGFAGVRKLDLDAYTGNDGKLRFTGLPPRVKNPPLEFRASKEKLFGTAVFNPEFECHAKHEIALVPKPADNN